MAKDLYAIILKDLGKRPEKVKEELISYGTADSDLEIILQRIEDGKPYTIAYAQTFNEAKLLKERFENSGALVDVGLKRAFKEKKLEILKISIRQLQLVTCNTAGPYS